MLSLNGWGHGKTYSSLCYLNGRIIYNNLLFHVSAIKQTIESVPMGHWGLMSQEVRMILQTWAEHESRISFVSPSFSYIGVL